MKVSPFSRGAAKLKAFREAAGKEEGSGSYVFFLGGASKKGGL